MQLLHIVYVALLFSADLSILWEEDHDKNSAEEACEHCSLEAAPVAVSVAGMYAVLWQQVALESAHAHSQRPETSRLSTL